MIDLHKLKVFTLVAQTGSFSRAAERLLITQSAVSQHVRDLEARLGATLFVRGPRGASLTEQGKILFDYAQKIFDLLAEAENAVTDVKKLLAGKINIGATPGVSVYLLPEWISTFRADYPNLFITLRTGTSQEIIADLRDGLIDFGVIEGELDKREADWLAITLLEEIEQLVVIGPKHPWWKRPSIALEELDHQGFVMRQPDSQTRIWLNQALKEYGIQPNVVGEFDNLESMKRAVTLGTCLAIMPPYVAQQEADQKTLRALSIESGPLRRTLKLIWNSHTPRSPTVQAFVTYLLTLFAREDNVRG